MLEITETVHPPVQDDGGRGSPQPARFAFGGVAFEVGFERPFRLSPAFARHALTVSSDSQLLAGVLRCTIQLDPALRGERFAVAGVVSERRGDCIHVSTDEMRGSVRRLDAHLFEGEARVAGGEASCDAVALALSSAVIEHQAGLHLHAAAIELDGRAVLFVGPSGAGKSTALGLTRGSRVLAHDRVSVFARAGRYYAFGLPGGESVSHPWSERRVLPLSAILRVRQGRGRPRIETLDGARRVFALRESVDVSNSALEAEERRMNAVLALSEAVAVAEIHSVLGVCHAAQVRAVMAPCTGPAARGASADALEVHSHAQL